GHGMEKVLHHRIEFVDYGNELERQRLMQVLKILQTFAAQEIRRLNEILQQVGTVHDYRRRLLIGCIQFPNRSQTFPLQFIGVITQIAQFGAGFLQQGTVVGANAVEDVCVLLRKIDQKGNDHAFTSDVYVQVVSFQHADTALFRLRFLFFFGETDVGSNDIKQ